MSLGKFSEAEKVLFELLKLVPDHPWVLVKWASVIHELGRRQEAVDVLDSVVARCPEFVFAKFVLAVFLSSQYPQDSERLVLEALKLDPENVTILNFYSRLLLQVGQPSKAKAILNAVIKIDPEYVDAHVSLSNAASAKGESEEANRHAQTALGIDPEEVTAHYALAAEHFNRRQYTDSYRMAFEILRMDPNNQAAAHILHQSDLNARWAMLPFVFFSRVPAVALIVFSVICLGSFGIINEFLKGPRIAIVLFVCLFPSALLLLRFAAGWSCRTWPRRPDGTIGAGGAA